MYKFSYLNWFLKENTIQSKDFPNIQGYPQGWDFKDDCTELSSTFVLKV